MYQLVLNVTELLFSHWTAVVIREKDEAQWKEVWNKSLFPVSAPTLLSPSIKAVAAASLSYGCSEHLPDSQRQDWVRTCYLTAGHCVEIQTSWKHVEICACVCVFACNLEWKCENWQNNMYQSVTICLHYMVYTWYVTQPWVHCLSSVAEMKIKSVSYHYFSSRERGEVPNLGFYSIGTSSSRCSHSYAELSGRLHEIREKTLRRIRRKLSFPSHTSHVKTDYYKGSP